MNLIMRDKILKILKEYRNTEIGNIALANIIAQETRSINNLTTESLAQLFIERGEKCYTKAGNLCEVTGSGIKIGKEVYLELLSPK